MVTSEIILDSTHIILWSCQKWFWICAKCQVLCAKQVSKNLCLALNIFCKQTGPQKPLVWFSEIHFLISYLWNRWTKLSKLPNQQSSYTLTDTWREKFHQGGACQVHCWNGKQDPKNLVWFSEIDFLFHISGQVNRKFFTNYGKSAKAYEFCSFATFGKVLFACSRDMKSERQLAVAAILKSLDLPTSLIGDHKKNLGVPTKDDFHFQLFYINHHLMCKTEIVNKTQVGLSHPLTSCWVCWQFWASFFIISSETEERRRSQHPLKQHEASDVDSAASLFLRCCNFWTRPRFPGDTNIK